MIPWYAALLCLFGQTCFALMGVYSMRGKTPSLFVGVVPLLNAVVLIKVIFQ